MENAALDLLRTTFGHPEFRGEQAEIVDCVVNGDDALVRVRASRNGLRVRECDGSF